MRQQSGGVRVRRALGAAVVGCLGIVTVSLRPLTLDAQVASLADRIGPLGDGEVYFSYPARDGVYGNGHGVTIVGPEDNWQPDECMRKGPVHIRLRVVRGEVTDLEMFVGGRWKVIDEDRNLGLVPAAEACAFLLTLARNASDVEVAEEAILPATLARDVDPWPAIVAIARDANRPRDVRESAVFWMGQESGRRMAEELEGVVDDPLEDIELRKHAVFALTQRPDPECIPILMRLARTHPRPEIRESALFWLGQKDDPRVLDLFEEILLDG